MKTVKNVVTRGLLVMVLTLMAMTAFSMVDNGAVSSVKAAKVYKTKPRRSSGKIKIPKNAKKAEKKAAKKLNKSSATVWSYKWKKGRLIQLEGEKIKPSQLKAFTELTELYLENLTTSEWKKADFSKYKKLKKLTLQNPISVKKVNISKNKKLTDLTIRNNKIDKKSALKKLDLSKNKNLKNLQLLKLPISKLDLSKNTKLQVLSMDEMDVSLDVSKLKNLQEFSIRHNNKITALSFDGASSLKDIGLSMCHNLKTISVTNCRRLKNFAAHGDQLAKINIKDCPALPPHVPYPTINPDGSKTVRYDDPGIRASGKWDSATNTYKYPVLSYDNKIYYYDENLYYEAYDIRGDWKLQN